MLTSSPATRADREAGRKQWRAPSDEDAALLRQAQAGHTLAFERIVWRYDEAILSLLLQLTSSEQEALALYHATFITAFRDLPRRDNTSLYIWLHRLATARWLKSRRSQRDRRTGTALQLSATEQLIYTLKVGQRLSLGTVAQILVASEDSVARTFRQVISKLHRAVQR